MTAVSAHALTQSADCKIGDCVRPAVSTRGMYAYLCSEHVAEAKRTKQSAGAATGAGASTSAKLRELGALARAVDKATAKRRKAQDAYEAAVDDEENAQFVYRSALREALGEDGRA